MKPHILWLEKLPSTVLVAVLVAAAAVPAAARSASPLRIAADSSHLPMQFLAPAEIGEVAGLPETGAEIHDILAPCNVRPGSHICDPEHLLSGGTFDQQSEALRRLSEVKKVSQCPGMGYEVYVAILNVAAEETHAAAVELGRRWGTLGGSEVCSAVIVYSARERAVAVAADKALEDTVLRAKVERSVEQAPFDSADAASADAVVSALVGQLSGVLDGSGSKQYVLVQQGAAIVLYGISSIIGLVATGLLVFCLYDIIAHWFHAMRFHNCQNKVKRVHEAFLNLQGELSLCPYCVNPVSNQPSSSHVVFLCGHRFHMECANRWFADEPSQSGQCAICTRGPTHRAETAKVAARRPSCACPPPSAPQPQEERVLSRPAAPQQAEAVREVGERLRQATVSPEETETSEAAANDTIADDEDGQNSMNSWDEAKSFMLERLHMEYPDIIEKDCLERWSRCHTEIWLSELRCPRYKSIFAKHTHK